MSDVDPAEVLLDQAKHIVSGARRNAYGNPEDNFRTIAELWQGYLQRRADRAYGPGARGLPDLQPHDVAVMMVLMKVARLAETPDHADGWRDIAGYAACGARASGANLGLDRPSPVTDSPSLMAGDWGKKDHITTAGPTILDHLIPAATADRVKPAPELVQLADGLVGQKAKPFKVFTPAETAFINQARLTTAPLTTLAVPSGTTRERLAELMAEISKPVAP